MKSTMLLSGDGYSGRESMFFNFSLCVLHFACYFAECSPCVHCRCFVVAVAVDVDDDDGSARKYNLPQTVAHPNTCVRTSGAEWACVCMRECGSYVRCVWGRSRLFLVLVARCVRISNVRALISTDTDTQALTHIHAARVSESMKGAFHHLYAVFCMENMKMLTCAVNTWAHDETEWRQWRQATGLRVVYVFYYDVIFFILLVCDWVLCS